MACLAGRSHDLTNSATAFTVREISQGPLPIIMQLKQQYHSAPDWTQRLEFLPPLMATLRLLSAGHWGSFARSVVGPLYPAATAAAAAAGPAPESAESSLAATPPSCYDDVGVGVPDRTGCDPLPLADTRFTLLGLGRSMLRWLGHCPCAVMAAFSAW